MSELNKITHKWSASKESKEFARGEMEADPDRLDAAYSTWTSLVNMTDEEMEMWDADPCADTSAENAEDVRDRTQMLLGSPKESWGLKNVAIAERQISFLEGMVEVMEENMPDDPSSGGEGTCPTVGVVKMLNRGHNPLESLPAGDPEPAEVTSSFDEPEGEAGLVYNDDGDVLELSFSATTLHESITDGFNEYGIKKNFKDGELVSVDAVYEAMEPGPPKDRNGVRITEDFLKRVAEKDYSDRPPHLMDHRYDTLSHIGFVQDVWFNAERGKLMVQARTYNTGADTHDEIVKRLTHEPPAISDGSLGFGQSYEAIENSDGERELVDGKIQEFSTTPFPGGYDEGGLRVAGQAD